MSQKLSYTKLIENSQIALEFFSDSLAEIVIMITPVVMLLLANQNIPVTSAVNGVCNGSLIRRVDICNINVI